MTGSSSLVFDSTLELCDPDGVISDADYWFEALADGASWGDPQPVEVALNSLMRDGAITMTTGDQNREATFLVKVRGSDSAALDAGVQALQLATRKRTTLVWTPPDGYCDPLVWDVETSNLLEPNGFDDLAYMLRNEQVFRLRLVCLPYRRTETPVVDDAGTPPSSGGDLLYSCESTSGWAAWDTATGVFAVDSVVKTEGAGSLRSTVATANITYLNWYNFYVGASRDLVTGLSLDTDAGGYLSVAVRTDWTYNWAFDDPAGRTGLQRAWMQIDGAWVEAPTPVAARQDSNDFVHYVWLVDGGLTITGLKFDVQQCRAGETFPTSNPRTWYDDVELLPSATTDHQIVKQHLVLGSARTTGSLRISSPSESVALGKVLAITMPTNAMPSGYQPDGERWITQGTPTADGTALAGHYYTPDASDYLSSAGKPIFDVPVSMLTPNPYTMVSLVKVESDPLVAGVQAQLLVDGVPVGPTSEDEISIPGLDAGWAFIPVGTVYLPPLPTQNADETMKVRLLFKGARIANVYMIPEWDVNGYPVADFSIVDCGTGTVEPGGASSSVFLDSPSIENQGLGAIYRGPSSDRSNSISAEPDAWKIGQHVFSPGLLSNFVVSLGAAGPTSTLTYYERRL